MRIESFQRAKTEIEHFFKSNSKKAYTIYDLQQIFEVYSSTWKIANYRSSRDFQKFLTDNEILEKLKFHQPNLDTEKTIWKRNNASRFEVGLAMVKDSYLSNYSALQLHNLTLQAPKSIYISVDKYAERHPAKINRKLLQENVDKAFSKPQRTSSEVYISKDNFKFFILHKKSESINVGVIDINGMAVTDVERTLIDSIVRPAYSGGVFEVLNAFINAKEKIEAKKLDDYLEKLDYLYPYHQLIGFYMEKAGFEKSQLKPFQDKISNIDFYLTYNINNKEYDPKWKIYYPTGF